VKRDTGLSLEEDLTSVRGFEPRHKSKKSRFAAPNLSGEDRALAFLDFQSGVLEDGTDSRIGLSQV